VVVVLGGYINLCCPMTRLLVGLWANSDRRGCIRPCHTQNLAVLIEYDM
jgi:hypothetical protein